MGDAPQRLSAGRSRRIPSGGATPHSPRPEAPGPAPSRRPGSPPTRSRTARPSQAPPRGPVFEASCPQLQSLSAPPGRRGGHTRVPRLRAAAWSVPSPLPPRTYLQTCLKCEQRQRYRQSQGFAYPSHPQIRALRRRGEAGLPGSSPGFKFPLPAGSSPVGREGPTSWMGPAGQG